MDKWFMIITSGTLLAVLLSVTQYYTKKVARLEDEINLCQQINSDNRDVIERLTRYNRAAMEAAKQVKQVEVVREKIVYKAKKESAVIDTDWSNTRVPVGVVERLCEYRNQGRDNNP